MLIVKLIRLFDEDGVLTDLENNVANHRFI